MGKGSPQLILRIPEEMLEEIKEVVDASLYRRKGEPLTVSSWIRIAIAEKLAHRKRSSGKSGKVNHVVMEEGKKLTREIEGEKKHNGPLVTISD